MYRGPLRARAVAPTISVLRPQQWRLDLPAASLDHTTSLPSLPPAKPLDVAAPQQAQHPPMHAHFPAGAECAVPIPPWPPPPAQQNQHLLPTTELQAPDRKLSHTPSRTTTTIAHNTPRLLPETAPDSTPDSALLALELRRDNLYPHARHNGQRRRRRREAETEEDG